MLTPKQSHEIDNWRKSWKTKGGHKLSITGCSTEEEVISKAIDKAHAPSVRRALKTGGISTKTPRADAKKLLTEKISESLHAPMSQPETDKWNEDLCRKIQGIYTNKGIADYTLGNAQKLLNMTIKYIFSSDIIDPDLAFFKVAHIPIDRIIMKSAKKKLKIDQLEKTWSATNDMQDLLNYQRNLRNALASDEFPILWEIKNW